MRHHLSALIVATLSISPALALQPIDGEGGYKFGMSPDQARAVPGQAFGAFAPKNLADDPVGTMAGKKPAMLGGLPYKLDLFFDGAQKLTDVALEAQTKSSQPDCEKAFLSLLSLLERSYGGFAPVHPQHVKNAQDQLPSTLVWQKQGASRYELSTVVLNDETVSNWEARKVSGADFVDIAVTWSGAATDTQNACLTDIDYRGH